MGGKPSKYRLTIPMEETTRASLKRLSEAMGDSMGSVAGQFLDELEPHFRATAEAIEELKVNPAASATGLHLMLVEAQQKALEVQADYFRSFNERGRENPESDDSGA